MTLDVGTLAVISNIVIFGCFLTMFAFWKTYPDRLGAGYWVLSLATVFIGYLLISLRLLIPPLLSIIAANILMTLSYILLDMGIRDLLQIKRRGPELVVVFILVFTGLFFFTYIKPSLSSRILIISGMYTVLSSSCLLHLKRGKPKLRRNEVIVLSTLFIIFGAFMAIRLIITLISPTIRGLDDFLVSGNFQATAFLVTLFFYSALVITFIWIHDSFLEAQRLILLSAIEQAPTSIIITDAGGDIEYVNPAFSVKTGFTSRESIGRNINMLKNPATDPEIFKNMWDALLSGSSWHGELLNLKKNGEQYWDAASMAPVKDRAGSITHFVSVNDDITVNKQIQERLINLANHDALTGLPSRRLVLDRLGSAIEMAERNTQIVGVLFADLDRFKEINDEFGHEIGDEVLKKVADLLQGSLRKADTVARLGGDEFLVVLPQIGDRDGAATVAQGMIDAISSSDEVGSIGLSVGIAIFPEHGSDAKELIRKADNAMYTVKGKGRNSWAFADTSGQTDRS